MTYLTKYDSLSSAREAVIEAAKAYYESGGDVDQHNELMDAVERLYEEESQ